LISLVLSACSGTGSSRKDAAPKVDKKKLAKIHDAVPRKDKVTRAGNKNPYTVFGKTYHLLPTSEGYKKKGTASWYGTKFHGRMTANGERYNVYAMTAAHKTLPIPCYARVTNLSNKRQVIVRVNDRGPFHGDRLIDLSYAAAVKLGFAEQGTAPVLVEVVTEESLANERKQKRLRIPVSEGKAVAALPAALPKKVARVPVEDKNVSKPAKAAGQKTAAVARSQPDNAVNIARVDQGGSWFLQTGAYRERSMAQDMQQRVKFITHLPVALREPVDALDGFFKVLVGPVDNEQVLRKLQQEMRAANMGSPFIVRD
jgi:rare lipoprotein A